jgi:hypothetical protein
MRRPFALTPISTLQATPPHFAVKTRRGPGSNHQFHEQNRQVTVVDRPQPRRDRTFTVWNVRGSERARWGEHRVRVGFFLRRPKGVGLLVPQAAAHREVKRPMKPVDDRSDVLVLNPSLRLSVTWYVRRANQPGAQFVMRWPEDLPLVMWLLSTISASGAQGDDSNDVDVEVPSDIIESAVGKGILVAPSVAPSAPPLFPCSVVEAPLELVPCSPLSDAELGSLRLTHGLCAPPTRLPEHRDGAEVSSELLGPLPSRAWSDVPPGTHRLWVRSSVGIAQPCDVCDEVARAILRGDHARLGELPRNLRQRLALADILVPQASADTAHWDPSSTRTQLQEQGFVVMRDILSPLQVAALRKYYRELRAAGFFHLDRHQVPLGRDGVYCEAVSLFFQQELGRVLNTVLPSPVRPTYTWFFRYRSGAILERHVDRPQCRWNVSVALDYERLVSSEDAWPIYVASGGETHEVRLGIGDALVYSGTDTPHWRDALPRQIAAASVWLFHYVEDGEPRHNMM